MQGKHVQPVAAPLRHLLPPRRRRGLAHRLHVDDHDADPRRIDHGSSRCRQDDLARAAHEDQRLQARREPGPALLARRLLLEAHDGGRLLVGLPNGHIRNVQDSEKHQVEIHYGLAPRSYGSTLEIDHIVSLELGGSNDIANLYPEKATLPGSAPGFRVKDKLENRLHDMVCDAQIKLRAAQRQIAANWQALYKKVYGVAPTG